MEPQVSNTNNFGQRFNRRNLILVFLLIFLIITIIIVQLLWNSNPPASNQITQSTGKLDITAVTPNPTNNIDLTTNFEINFSKPTTPNDVYIQSSPFTAINLLQGNTPQKVIITPQGVWTDGQNYKLTILGTTKSIDQATLQENYNIDFRAENLLREVLEASSGGDH